MITLWSKRFEKIKDRIFDPKLKNNVRIDGVEYGLSHFVLKKKWEDILKLRDEAFSENSKTQAVVVRVKARLVLYKPKKGEDEEKKDVVVEQNETDDVEINPETIQRIEFTPELARAIDEAFDEARRRAREFFKKEFSKKKYIRMIERNADINRMIAEKKRRRYERRATVIRGVLDMVFEREGSDKPINWEFYSTDGRLIYAR